MGRAVGRGAYRAAGPAAPAQAFIGGPSIGTWPASLRAQTGAQTDQQGAPEPGSADHAEDHRPVAGAELVDHLAAHVRGRPGLVAGG